MRPVQGTWIIFTLSGNALFMPSATLAADEAQFEQ
jgi:hypothetical protein